MTGLRWLILPCLALCCLSCTTTSGGRGSTEPAHNGNPAAEKIVSMVGNRLTIETVRDRKINDLLNIQLTVRNPANSTYQYRYLFEWYDGSGFKYRNPSEAWIRRYIQPGQQVDIVGIAPNPKVVDWKITIQPWRD